MTYFGFLLRFLGIPIVILAIIAYLDQRRGKAIPANFRSFPLWAATVLHIVLAIVYTTPWDNYLVATGVWYYDPALVAGIVLGWVPIEEYTFFVVQTILAGLWLSFLLRRLPLDNAAAKPLAVRWRIVPLAVVGVIWLASVLMLISGWPPGTYLSLELSWALLPIMVQIGFGGDILRRYARLVILSLGSMTLYLCLADLLAIGSGTWEIDPAQSLHWLIAGVLPLEEIVFFLLTNTLITFGVVLLLAEETRVRFGEIRAAVFRRGRQA